MKTKKVLINDEILDLIKTTETIKTLYAKFNKVDVLGFVNIEDKTYALYLLNDDDGYIYESLVNIDCTDEDEIGLRPYFRVKGERIYYNEMRDGMAIIDGYVFKKNVTKQEYDEFKKRIREEED